MANANGQGAKTLDPSFQMIVLASMPITWSIVVTTLQLAKTSSKVIAQLTLHGHLLMQDNLTPSTTTTTSTHALATNSR
jgi:hypothetical protein